MTHEEADGAYETLLRDHQELVAELEALKKDRALVVQEAEVIERERDGLKLKHERLLKLLKDGDVFIRDLDIPAGEWGYARSMFREIAAWMEEEKL